MNKKGSMILGIVFGVFVFISGVLFMPFLADDITTARSDLSCSDTSISGGTKITCLSIGAVMPYFIWFFTSMTLGFIIGSSKS